MDAPAVLLGHSSHYCLSINFTCLLWLFSLSSRAGEYLKSILFIQMYVFARYSKCLYLKNGVFFVFFVFMGV